jgi:hypothetical protein
VCGRNRDDAFIADCLSRTPAISLEIGPEQTYRWIDDLMTAGEEHRDGKRPDRAA